MWGRIAAIPSRRYRSSNDDIDAREQPDLVRKPSFGALAGCALVRRVFDRKQSGAERCWTGRTGRQRFLPVKNKIVGKGTTNAPILLLDEPTAALDTKSERLVIEATERLMNGRTVVTVAHRLSAIRDADKNVVLKNGMVCEQGTHAELMALGAVYAQLHAAQFESGPRPQAPSPYRRRYRRCDC